jgi:hypothetical protein
MNQAPLVKIPAATAAEICAHFHVPSDARKLLQEGMAPAAFVESLVANKHFVPAIDFLSHALPLREGVWWGCLCMQHACGNRLPAPEYAAARAAVQWVLQPTEESRAAAKAPAEAAGPATPAGALAISVTLSGFAGSRTVANAVKLASIRSEPVEVAGVQKAFVQLGMEIAEGRYI